MTRWIFSFFPSKSGISVSIVVPGFTFFMALTVSAQNEEPPSGRSSRSTDVITQCFRLQGPYRFGESCWFPGIGRKRFSCLCCTEFAGPGADISKDHESCSACIPAFPYIRTVSAGADCMKMIICNEPFYPGIILPACPLHFKPLR